MKTLGVIAIALAALVASGCQSMGPETAAPTVDTSGKWVGTWVAVSQAQGSGTIEMTIKQTGNKYNGNLVVTGTVSDPSGYTEGVVSGDQLRILRPSNVTGNLTVKGDTMTGVLGGVVAANVTLKKQP